ncbi:hypothetical protein M3Y97_00234000 [Aphelenchoides bicaudatus]|nr:hypothetical protein M3Y97_00234000 [Aphelenchoides bicaudatus]
MVEDVQTLMEPFGEGVFEITEDGKILCKLTSHEFVCNSEDFKKYIQTKKFKKAHGVYAFGEKYGEFFEDIGNNLYGCKLTMRTVSNNPDSLNGHVNGKKFKNALRKHQEKLLKEANEPAKEGGDAVQADIPTQEETMSSEEEEDEEEVEEEKPKRVHRKRTKESGTNRKVVKKSRKS